MIIACSNGAPKALLGQRAVRPYRQASSEANIDTQMAFQAEDVASLTLKIRHRLMSVTSSMGSGRVRPYPQASSEDKH